ncbi:MAG TPA: hypothetical protein VMZ03_13990 [Chitinophagaceae bacterium]|nr:hypothetical protein [Chitinophagaceae bacterium]
MSYSPQTRSDLKNWVTAYRMTLPHPQETKSCLISKEDLASLMNYIKNHDEIDGIRIYLIRKDDIVKVGFLAEGLPQFSFALVPTTGYRKGDAKDVKDFFVNESIECIIPGFKNENSGLCPVNCGTLVDD